MTVASSVRTRVKLCGMTRDQDIEAAVALGADAIGLVCVRGSKRELSPSRAAELRSIVPPMVTVVLLLSNASAAEARSAIEQVRPDLVQFHGSETPQFCDDIGWPYLRAVSVSQPGDVEVAASSFTRAKGLLLDAHGSDGMGGTGHRFDWNVIPSESKLPLILAGGLHASNVGEAVRMRPLYGVDVSSGIESSPGLKDLQKMRAFMDAVRQADELRQQ